MRLLGLMASSFESESQQENLLEGRTPVNAGSELCQPLYRLRDKFGESSVSMASGMKAPASANVLTKTRAGLPGKGKAQE